MRRECLVCDGLGCEFCPKTEPWPQETWADMTDQDLEQLILDGADELARRACTIIRLELLWIL